MLSARVQEGLPARNADLLQGLQAIDREGRGDHGQAFHACAGQARQLVRSGGLQPLVPAQARLEGHRILVGPQPQRPGCQMRRCKYLMPITHRMGRNSRRAAAIAQAASAPRRGLM